MTDPVAETLQSRDTTHGHYPYVAATIQELKQVARTAEARAMQHSQNKKVCMNAAQQEGLEMILHKIGRILNGDPNTADHWHDIAGYATLNSNLITKGTHL